MKMYKKRNVIFLLVIFCLFSFSYSIDLKPFAQIYTPMDVTISKDSNNVKSELKWQTDLVIEAGFEVLFSAEFSPMRYGFGLGFRSPQQENGSEATPASIPVWGAFSFGRINKENFFSPFLAFRVGTLPPLTGNGNWWERPLNYFFNGGVGVVFPYGITTEVNFDYSSMEKSYEDKDLRYRVSSFRLGIQLAMNIELTRDKIYKARSR